MDDIMMYLGIAIVLVVGYFTFFRKPEKVEEAESAAPYKVETPEVAPVTAPIVEATPVAKAPRKPRATTAKKPATVTKPVAKAKAKAPAKKPVAKAKSKKA